MRNILAIAGRQFRSYFNSPVAYIVICLVLIALGFFFWQTFFLIGSASTREMFRWLSLIMIFAMPALTMGLLADEKRTGTIELLITMPVTEAQVVIGKFLGVFGLYAVLLALTLPYPISVATLGALDWGPVVAGYLGLLFEGAALISLGLMASSWTANQLIALFIALGLCTALWLVDKFLPFLPMTAASVLEWFSIDVHFENMAKGVIDIRDCLYFITAIAIGLGVAFRSLQSRRWS